jgi:DNA-binding PadR family transcriptional regulator
MPGVSRSSEPSKPRSETRVMILSDLSERQYALSVLRSKYGGYAYPCVYKMELEGLVAQDDCSLAYKITPEGREWLGKAKG